MAANQPGSVVEALRFLINEFKFERYVYLGINITAVLFLLGCCLYASSKGNWVIAASMFGSGGLIAIVQGRVMKMWDDCTKIITTGITSGNL